MLFNKNLHYICELKIDGRVKDKAKTDDYEVWYDKITDTIYELKGFRKIKIRIQVCDS